jgi:capsular polysaccharide biosynthesis protein
VLTSGSVNTNDSDSLVVSAKKIKKTNSNDSVSNLVPKVSNENESHTVVIYGDSHTRGCASKVKYNLNKTFNVTGLVKPGSDIRTLTNTDKGAFHNLMKNDVIIFWGGANDVKKNNTKEGLRHVLNFVRNNTHTNIILMSVPHRHHLVSWSCVNNEVDVFNRKLEKIMKCHEHVTVVRNDLNRDVFTRHGLHLSNAGKEMIAQHVAAICTKIFEKNVIPISMHWKDNHTDNDNIKTYICSDSNNSRSGTLDQRNETLQKSQRQRKPPVTKKDDFLW